MHVKHHFGHFLKNSILPFSYSILSRSSKGWIFMFNSSNSQKWSISTLSNSLPLSLLILTIGWPFSTWILVRKDFKCSIVSNFSLKKHMKENLEKFSTTTRTYLLPPLLLVPDSSPAAAPFDSRFDPRQRRHLIRAQLVSQLIRVQLVLLDWGINQQNL